MRITKPGDPGKKPKRVAKYLFGCRNCGCEFLCDEKEDTVLSDTFYGFDPEKWTFVSEIEVYGIWKVTTEGDCEGRSSRNLGIFEGYLDDIAFYLVDKAYYTLEFEKISIPRISHEDVRTEQSEVNVSLDISSETWDMSSKERIQEFKKLLSRRNVHVTESQFYASVKLCQNAPTEEERRQKALSKLTRDEIGLDDPETVTPVNYAFCPNCGKPAESLRTIWRDV